MNWKQFLDRFDLNDDLILDHEIQPVTAIEPHFLVNNRQRPLFVNPEPAFLSSKARHDS